MTIRNLILTSMRSVAALASGTTAFSAPPKPVPTHADVSYGSSPHQLIDVHLPTNGSGPFAVLMWYGVIWEPSKHVPDLNRFLPKNIAVIGVETRTLNDGMKEKANPPVSYVMNDARRAVQFVRLNATKWNVDPQKIAVEGGSQGALPALYVGCVADRADPQSNDQIERLSTKVTCVAAYRSQSSIDPKRMQEWVPGVKWGAPALGCSFEESLQRREDLLPLIESWSPDALLNKGAASDPTTPSLRNGHGLRARTATRIEDSGRVTRPTQCDPTTYGFVSSGETISAAPGVFGVCLVDVPPPHPVVNKGTRQTSTNIDTALNRRIIKSPERQKVITLESRGHTRDFTKCDGTLNSQDGG